MSSVDTERFRQMLLEERDRVRSAIENIRRENPGSMEEETGEETHFDQHLADAATVMHDRELDYTLEENSDTVLGRIEAALGRIDAGTYGTCRVCGRPIDPERLEAQPWTDLCIEDARKLQRG